MAANWGENTWGSSGWGGYTLLNSNAAAGAVGSLTASISVDIGISRFLLEDGSGYLLLEDGSYLMEEAGTGPIPSINGAVGTVVQAKTIALTGVSETSAVGSATPSTTVAGTGVSATGNAGTNPADTSELLVGVTASGGVGSLTPSITVSIVPGWGLGAWGSGVWGSSSPAIAGTVGDSTPATSVANTGVFAAGNTSSVTPDKTAALSGVASSGNIGTVAPSTEVSINAGWGAGAWGAGAWGAGSTITGAVGFSTPNVIPELDTKMGFMYNYETTHGALSLDLGWLWAHYVNAIGNYGLSTNRPITSSLTNFGVQGLYADMKWIGNLS